MANPDRYIPKVPEGIILQLSNFTPTGWVAKAHEIGKRMRMHTAITPRDAVKGVLEKLAAPTASWEGER